MQTERQALRVGHQVNQESRSSDVRVSWCGTACALSLPSVPDDCASRRCSGLSQKA